MDVVQTGLMITVVVGDLTRQDTQVIVNAANRELAHGGGVAAALARAGGEAVQAESDAWVTEHGALADGEAAVTTAGEMSATWIVHVAGPIFSGAEDDPARLAAAVTAALNAVLALGARSVAMPAISTGIYGYPMDEALTVITQATTAWETDHPEWHGEVRFVTLDGDVAERWGKLVGGAS